MKRTYASFGSYPGDSPKLLRRYLRQTFRHVYLVFSVDGWRRSSRSTLVLVAGDTPLDRAGLEDTSPLLARQLLSDPEVAEIMAEGEAVTLTDRYAPVDQLLAAVFLSQVTE